MAFIKGRRTMGICLTVALCGFSLARDTRVERYEPEDVCRGSNFWPSHIIALRVGSYRASVRLHAGAIMTAFSQANLTVMLTFTLCFTEKYILLVKHKETHAVLILRIRTFPSLELGGFTYSSIIQESCCPA